MDWLESYSNGHAADLSGFTVAVPLWLQSLGWQGFGLWLEIDPNDLLAAIPGMQIHSVGPPRPRFTIIDVPEDSFSLGEVYRKMEDNLFPHMATGVDLLVSCPSCLLTRNFLGGTDLVGRFELTSAASRKNKLPPYMLPRRMSLVEAPGSGSIGFDSICSTGFSVVAHFSSSHPAQFEYGASKDLWASEHTLSPPTRPSVRASQYKSLRSFFKG